MNEQQQTNEVACGGSALTAELGTADKLRALIPSGDGYNSDYANTLADAAHEIERLRHAVLTLLGETEDSDYMSAQEQRMLARQALVPNG